MGSYVYLGMSIDGYIAGPAGDLEWLEYVPVPDGDDLGFGDFMADIDAVIMGRRTFETLVGFDVGWHYGVPGMILSSTLKSVPDAFAEQVQIASGSPTEIIELAAQQGFRNLYIDGGDTVRRFLDADRIDEMILSEIPVLLGGGTPLFGPLTSRLDFELMGSEVLAGQILKKRLRRRRSQPSRDEPD